MNWLTSAVVAAAFLSASNVFIKWYLPKLGSGLSMFYFALGGLLMTILLTFVVKVGDPAVKNVGNAPFIAIIAGLVWAVGNYFVYTMFTKNSPLSIAMPIVVGGIGVGGVISGVLLFHESLNVVQIIGILVVLTGSVILAKG